MLGHRLRRWPSINPTLGQRFVCAAILVSSQRTREIEPLLFKCWPAVYDVSQTLPQWLNVSCLMGCPLVVIGSSQKTPKTLYVEFLPHLIHVFFLFTSHLKVVLFTGPVTLLTIWVFFGFNDCVPIGYRGKPVLSVHNITNSMGKNMTLYIHFANNACNLLIEEKV